jgi:hypothetical protein
MYNKNFSFTIFDLENLVFSVCQFNTNLINAGILDPALKFTPRLFVQPVINSVLNRVRKWGFRPLYPIFVTGKNARFLLPRICRTYDCRIAKENLYNSGPGDQSADLEIAKILDAAYDTIATDIPIILVSGDGGFVTRMGKLYKKGHSVRVVAPEWALNRAYYREIGEDSILPLTKEWLIKEIIPSVIRMLPKAE